MIKSDTYCLVDLNISTVKKRYTDQGFKVEHLDMHVKCKSTVSVYHLFVY